MKCYHQRIFVLHYSENELPKFETDEEALAFQQAVGRMVLYGLQTDEALTDMLDVVTAGLTKEPLELCAAYHAPLRLHNIETPDGGRYTGSLAQVSNDFLNSLINAARNKHRAFVMAAVQHSPTQYGFHS